MADTSTPMNWNPWIMGGSALASLGGALMSTPRQTDWGQLGSQYINQLNPTINRAYTQNWNSAPLAGLTMGAGNAYDYANSAMAKFRASPAYAAMLANLSNASNAASQQFQGGLAGGLNTGVGQGLASLGNVNTMFNTNMMNANAGNYMNAVNQFNPLAQLRQQGAMDLTQGAMRLAGQGMAQYQQTPSWQQQLGGGLMGLGNAGFNYLSYQPQRPTQLSQPRQPGYPA